MTTFAISPRAARGIALLATLFALSSCGGVQLASVTDTQFLLTNRILPLRSMMVVYDTRDLGMKAEVEQSLVEALRSNADVVARRDIDLFSPLKTLSEKEKVWALKDNDVKAVLYIGGKGSGRPLRDWLYTEAKDIDTGTPAWSSSVVRLFLPETGEVIWTGSLSGEETGPEVISTRGFASAVASELVRLGMIAVRRPENPALRGFNR